jgi:hypothetical protein
VQLAQEYGERFLGYVLGDRSRAAHHAGKPVSHGMVAAVNLRERFPLTALGATNELVVGFVVQARGRGHLAVIA